ncbi:C40 family peptidase [Rhizomonospora bruguierae]|uniref:C40 family peptidase n=1 Tax=Rhizomonospora bruguierae TaxID=1581705 RepID=UPI0020BF1A1F|nr:NlpC/P60 family protein [Micromonospora sp. NBRC 107566]
MKQPGVRSRTLRGLVVFASVIALVVAPASTAAAVPSPAEIEKQIDKAWEKLEPVIEQYNKVHSQLLANRKKSAGLQAKMAPLQLQVDLVMGQVGGIAAQQYRLGPASTLNAVLVNGSPQTLGDQLAVLNYLARSNTRKISGAVRLRDKYAQEQAKIDALVAQQARLDADLAAKKKTIQAEVDRLQKLRIEAYGSSTSGGSLRIGPCPAVYPGGAAGTAVKVACAQIGKPYVWGAVGPGSFDCSGLTQYAWKAAGVSLTHYTGAQWNEGAPVSRANLRAGDLVFFYSDVHHVGMYVGNNLIVHASRAGVPVKMAKLDSMPYVGARRPG